MNGPLRLFLLLCAVASLVMALRKIRKSKIQVADALFWFFFAGSFVVLAAFPQIAYAVSGLLGFDSPSNFIFLYVIAVLVMREFSLTLQVARLRAKLNGLVQEIALREKR